MKHPGAFALGSMHAAGSLVDALEGLDRAARSCMDATVRWRDAAASLPDPGARELVDHAVERSLARCDELLALLSLVDAVALTSGRPTVTVGSVLGRATGGVAGRYPAMAVRVRSALSTQRRGVSPAAAAALAVAVCGALGNAARHGDRDGIVTVRAEAGVKELVVTVDNAAPLAAESDPGPIEAGRGIMVAAGLVREAHGTHRVECRGSSVRVTVTIPVVPRWPQVLPVLRSARAAPGAASGVVAEAALRIQGAHGMGTPLREALWLVDGVATARLLAALDALERAAEAVSARRRSD